MSLGNLLNIDITLMIYRGVLVDLQYHGPTERQTSSQVRVTGGSAAGLQRDTGLGAPGSKDGEGRKEKFTAWSRKIARYYKIHCAPRQFVSSCIRRSGNYLEEILSERIQIQSGSRQRQSSGEQCHDII